MPAWAVAWFWGLVAGSALLGGAATGYLAALPQRLIAGIMAFGGGVLISVLAFNLMESAYERGGFGATAIGFLGGASVYTLANWYLSRRGAGQRKRSGDRQPSEQQHSGSGLTIAIGSLLDSVPEAIVIGLGLIGGGPVSWVTVAGVFVSNVPEGLSSSAGMKQAGRSPRYIFTVWGAITLATSAGALIGYTLFQGLSADVIAATTAVAAGAVLAMLADTMMPEAFEHAHDFTGLITVAGFLLAFILAKAGN